MWCGVVWCVVCGVVWCDVVWCGVVFFRRAPFETTRVAMHAAQGKRAAAHLFMHLALASAAGRGQIAPLRVAALGGGHLVCQPRPVSRGSGTASGAGSSRAWTAYSASQKLTVQGPASASHLRLRLPPGTLCIGLRFRTLREIPSAHVPLVWFRSACSSRERGRAGTVPTDWLLAVCDGGDYGCLSFKQVPANFPLSPRSAWVLRRFAALCAIGSHSIAAFQGLLRGTAPLSAAKSLRRTFHQCLRWLCTGVRAAAGCRVSLSRTVAHPRCCLKLPSVVWVWQMAPAKWALPCRSLLSICAAGPAAPR